MNPVSAWQHVRTRTTALAEVGGPLRRGLAAAALATLAGAAWQGGAAGTAAAVAASAVLVWGLRRTPAGGVLPAGAGSTTEPDALVEAVSRARRTEAAQTLTPAHLGQGSGAMVNKVIPVWGRQLVVTRTAADEGMGELLGAFSGMSDKLEALTQQLESFKPSAEPGAVAVAIEAQRPALAALLQPMTRAFAQRDAMVGLLGECATATARLQQLTKEARELGRHTRLVAFNASIEANRGGRGSSAGAAADNGSQPVANEVRALAGRVTEVCDQMDQLLAQMAASTSRGHRDGLLHDTTPDELQLEIELRARQALEAMMASLGTALQGSADVHEAGRALREQLDQAFTHFQFGDRVAQMLQIIGDDMTAMGEWLQTHPDASPGDAHAWLQRLEQKYTMDEQRSEHHGTQHIDRGTAVEFF